jgi:hypothetical protein
VSETQAVIGKVDWDTIHEHVRRLWEYQGAGRTTVHKGSDRTLKVDYYEAPQATDKRRLSR